MSWRLKEQPSNQDIKFVEQGKFGPCTFRINVIHSYHKHDEKRPIDKLFRILRILVKA